jgi:hypothetical protein
MKTILWLTIGMILIGMASAECSDSLGIGRINKSTVLCSDTYDMPEGIKITSDNLVLDCGTAIIRGNYQKGTGITIENRKNITITRCHVLTYNVGIFISNSTQVHLYDNGMLKNDIGVRMYNAYENIIEKHNDKSIIKPVSAIMSKFNIVMLGNKNIERSFCEVNSCNKYEQMNPCVDDDFYCSDKCTPETDNDCKKEVIKEKKPEPPKEPIIEKTPDEKTEEQAKKIEDVLKRGLGKVENKHLMYIAFYVIGLILFQFIHYVKRFDKEDR